MPDNNPIAALPVRHRFWACGTDRNVVHAVPCTQHAAGRGGKNVDPRSHGRERGKSKVGAAMTIVGKAAAGIVLCLGRGVPIDIVLDDASAPQVTIDWEL